MSDVTAESFARATVVRELPKTIVQVIDLPSGTVARMQLEPGWTWAECVGPTVGTDKCEQHHSGVLVAGSMRITAAPGDYYLIPAGCAYEITPGHLAAVEGPETVIAFEFDPITAETFGVRV